MTKRSSLSQPDHPVWKLLRMIVVGGFVLASLWLFYDRLDNRDVLTILTAMAGVFGYDMTKSAMTKRENQDGNDVPKVEE